MFGCFLHDCENTVEIQLMAGRLCPCLTHKKIPKNRNLYSAAIQDEAFAFLQTVFLFFAGL